MKGVCMSGLLHLPSHHMYCDLVLKAYLSSYQVAQKRLPRHQSQQGLRSPSSSGEVFSERLT